MKYRTVAGAIHSRAWIPPSMNTEGRETPSPLEICTYKHVTIKSDCFEVIPHISTVEKIRKDYDFARVTYLDDFDISTLRTEPYGGQAGIDSRHGSRGSDHVL